MLHFLHNLMLFMTGESLEPRWHAFEAQAVMARSADDLRTSHAAFLDGCLHDCLLTAPDLLRPLTKLVTLCLLFANRMAEDVERHRPDDEEVSREADARRRREQGSASPRPVSSPRGGGQGHRLTREERKRASEGRRRAARLRLLEERTRHTMLQEGWQGMVHKSASLFDRLLRQFMARLLARAEGLTVGGLDLGGGGVGFSAGGQAGRSHVQ